MRDRVLGASTSTSPASRAAESRTPHPSVAVTREPAGAPATSIPVTKPVINFLDPRLSSRFWDKVQPCPMTGCWIWTAAINKVTGYGAFQRGRRGEGVASTHRHAYETLVGAVPAGLVLDHLCRVRECCNPAHLEPVTNLENCLRGDARFNGNSNRIKTHCPRGHAYAGENVYIHNGKRQCVLCGRNRVRARRAREGASV